jgi:lipoprotein LprG
MRYIQLCLTLIALFLAACSGQPAEPTAVPTPTPTPQELAASIGKATRAAQSVHFAITLTGKPVKADTSGLFTLNSVEGDLKRPDGVLAILEVTGLAGVAEIRSVSLAGKQYLTNPITRQWSCLPPGAALDPVVLFDETKGVEYLLEQELTEVSMVGVEDIDGKPHYHLKASLPAEPLQAISLGLLGAGPVSLEIWAEQASLRASRIVLVDTASDPAEPSTWTMVFSDYDKTVEVRAPVAC